MTYKMFSFRSKPRANRSDFTSCTVWVGGGLGFHGLGVLINKHPVFYTKRAFSLEIGLIFLQMYVLYEV